MQQFKVGDRVKVIGTDYTGTIVDPSKYDTTIMLDGCEKIVVCNYYEIEIYTIIEPQTVYAVCDENNQAIGVYMDESKAYAARDYMIRTHEDTSLTIRPFHLTPVNE